MKELNAAWGIIDELKFITSLIGESDDFSNIPAKEIDKLQNMLIGLYTLYNYKFIDLHAQILKETNNED